MSTVDPLQAALGPEPTGEEANLPAQEATVDHPMLARYGGDVTKALDALQELNRTFGQEGHRLGQQVKALESQLAELQASQQQTPDPQEAGMPDMQMDQLQAWFDENPAQATAYLIAQGQQMMADQFQATLDQRLAPLETNVGRVSASNLMENLKASVGPEVVSRNAQFLIELKESDPDFFVGDPQKVLRRLSAAVTAADVESGQRSTPTGVGTPDVSVAGGSGGRTPQASAEPDEAEAFKNELLAKAAGGLDIFGNARKAPA